MAENILEQLEWLRGEFYDVDSVTSIIDLAANEIERLRKDLHHANEFALELRHKLDLANHKLRRYET